MLFKIEFLSLDSIDSAYCKTFLHAFGPTLRELDLSSGSNNNFFALSDLVPCTNLETLWISGFHSLDPRDVLPLSSETFLPNLKSFRSFICLGHRSYVFEQKRTLTLLDLNCSHIGTGVIILFISVLKYTYSPCVNLFYSFTGEPSFRVEYNSKVVVQNGGLVYYSTYWPFDGDGRRPCPSIGALEASHPTQGHFTGRRAFIQLQIHRRIC